MNDGGSERGNEGAWMARWVGGSGAEELEGTNLSITMSQLCVRTVPCSSQCPLVKAVRS